MYLAPRHVLQADIMIWRGCLVLLTFDLCGILPEPNNIIRNARARPSRVFELRNDFRFRAPLKVGSQYDATPYVALRRLRVYTRHNTMLEYRKLWLLSACYLLSAYFLPVLEHGLLSACGKINKGGQSCRASRLHLDWSTSQRWLPLVDRKEL